MRHSADVVNNSATRNHAQLIPSSGLQSFKPVPGISKLHRVRFSSLHPGIFVRESLDAAEREIRILKVLTEDVLAGHLPPATVLGSLPRDRRQDLYNQIRRVMDSFKNELCPPSDD